MDIGGNMNLGRKEVPTQTAATIAVEGIGQVNKAEALAALFNRARTQGMGVLQYKAHHVMSKEEAERILGLTQHFDYMEGRVMKVDFGGAALNLWGYDRDNGQGAGVAAIMDALTTPTATAAK